MLNKNILPKKIPYMDQFSSPEEAYNYLAKTLNSSFREDFLQDYTTPFILDGVVFERSWSDAGGIFTPQFIFNHNFGKLPSGWIILDDTHTDIAAGGSYNLWRASWTDTNIILNMYIDVGSAIPTSGEIKILVLR